MGPKKKSVSRTPTSGLKYSKALHEGVSPKEKKDCVHGDIGGQLGSGPNEGWTIAGGCPRIKGEPWYNRSFGGQHETFHHLKGLRLANLRGPEVTGGPPKGEARLHKRNLGLRINLVGDKTQLGGRVTGFSRGNPPERRARGP